MSCDLGDAWIGCHVDWVLCFTSRVMVWVLCGLSDAWLGRHVDWVLCLTSRVMVWVLSVLEAVKSTPFLSRVRNIIWISSSSGFTLEEKNSRFSVQRKWLSLFRLRTVVSEQRENVRFRKTAELSGSGSQDRGTDTEVQTEAQTQRHRHSGTEAQTQAQTQWYRHRGTEAQTQWYRC